MSSNSPLTSSVQNLLAYESLLQEQLKRQEAQSQFAKFIDYLDVGVKPAKHHQLLIEKLEAVERGDLQRLMVLMPPGSAKSTYTSVLFPPWFMGRHPQSALLGVSNATTLAERFSRRARNHVASPRFRHLFGFGCSEDAQAAGSWETERGGEFFAAGIGSTITGRRADGALIDDPVKSREEADSDRVRDKHWDWYVNDFTTRLKPNAWQILIQTRWHEDDLGGRILEREANRWAVLKLPMEAIPGDPLGRAPGERLWPEWFTDDMVSQAKLDTRSWNALYQQDPVPDEGEFFKREDFGEYTELPKTLHIYGASDYAVTEGDGDYTEHGVFGLDPQGDIYVLDWWYGQTKPDVWIEKQCDLILTHSPLVWFGESGVIKKAIEPYLKRRMEERQAFCRLEWLSSIVDKPVRARPFQARSAMGKVHFPRVSQWRQHVFSQLMRFPTGKLDDAVDVCTLLGRGLEFARSPTVSKPTTLPARQSWGF